jgi:hypothetical protein
MSLVGTYVNVAQNYTLVITEANDSNGTGKGTMNWGPHAIPVTLHYHFKNSGGPETCLWVVGNQDDPNKYFAGAGYTNNQGYASIQIGMSLATEGRVDTMATRLDRK